MTSSPAASLAPAAERPHAATAGAGSRPLRPSSSHDDPVGPGVASTSGRARSTIVVRARRSAPQRPEQRGSGLGVEPGGRLVEDEHRRVADQRPGDREPLALAARQRPPALAEPRVVAVRQRRARTRARPPPAPPPRSSASRRPAGRSAMFSRTVPSEQQRLLQQQRRRCAQRVERQVAQVVAVEQHGARARVVEAQQQPRERRLAGAARARRARRSRPAATATRRRRARRGRRPGSGSRRPRSSTSPRARPSARASAARRPRPLGRAAR